MGWAEVFIGGLCVVEVGAGGDVGVAMVADESGLTVGVEALRLAVEGVVGELGAVAVVVDQGRQARVEVVLVLEGDLSVGVVGRQEQAGLSYCR